MTEVERMIVEEPETVDVIMNDIVNDGEPYGYLVIHKVYPLYGVSTNTEDIQKDVRSLRYFAVNWLIKKLLAWKGKES